MTLSVPSVLLSVPLLVLGLLLCGCKMAAAVPSIFSLHSHVQGKKWGRDSNRKLSFLTFYQEAKHFPGSPQTFSISLARTWAYGYLQHQGRMRKVISGKAWWDHHVGLNQSWFRCLGRSPQPLNSRAVQLLPEQNSSSGFCKRGMGVWRGRTISVIHNE